MTDEHLSEDQVLAFVDGELSAQEVSRVEKHVAACPLCRGRVKDARAGDALLGGRAGCPSIEAIASYAEGRDVPAVQLHLDSGCTACAGEVERLRASFAAQSGGDEKAPAWFLPNLKLSVGAASDTPWDWVRETASELAGTWAAFLKAIHDSLPLPKEYLVPLHPLPQAVTRDSTDQANSPEELPKDTAQRLGKLLRIGMDDVSIRLHLAYALLRLDQPKEAIHHLEAVLQKEPGNPCALAELGHAFLLTGRQEEAAHHLRRAYDLLPGDPRVLYYIGLLAATEGRWREAAQLLRRALAKGPVVKPVQAIARKLEEKAGPTGGPATK